MADELAPSVRSTLIEELEQLSAGVHQVVDGLSDEQLWKRPLEPGNSVGHLVLHLTGNLNYFVGAKLGNTGYIREREREFTEAQPPPREVLLNNLDAAVAMFRRVVENLDADRLLAAHPEARFGSVLKALLFLVTHFAIHRGQISYIVRLVK
jgi:uncharacterized damage-inducible protein DinB